MNGWPLKSLGEIATIYGGSTPPREDSSCWGGSIPWVTPTDLPPVDTGVSVISKTKECITDIGLSRSSATVVPSGTVLFSSRATIGKVAITEVPVATNQGFANFVPHTGMDAHFLAYALWAHRDDIARLSGSTTFKEVNRGNIRKYRLSVPPLTEQKRIVKLLSEADALRKLRAEADNRTADFIPALFQEMFGEPRLEGVAWPELSLGSIVDFLSGGTPSKEKPEFWGGTTPWVSPKDMKADEIKDAIDHVQAVAFESTNLRLVPKNTVLIVVRGMILAHTVPIAICRVPVAINQDMKALVPKQRIEPEFLWAALRAQHNHLLNQVSTASHGTKKIETKDLRSILIAIPPLSSQKEFASRVKEIRKLEAAQVTSRLRLHAMFQSLLHRAFSGEL
jgi:type I restriction enzyme, S subunit